VSSSSSIATRALAAPVVIIETRVTPMSSAVDVAAVRRGLRRVLADARRAAGPPTPATRPKAAATRGSQKTDPTMTPTSDREPPRTVANSPTSMLPDIPRATPPARSASPPTVASAASTALPRAGPHGPGAAAGRMAASGATRDAARAGASAAARVTSRPTARGTRRAGTLGVMVAGSATPRSKPGATMSPTRTSRDPATTPAAEASAPRIAASSRTLR
jgi:hypothetical protein